MNRAWPADRIERRSLQSLAASERNARTHSAEQIGQIAASMQRWGWTVPILVDEGGEIIAGHGRLEAARQLGLVDAPVMVATGWSEPEKRAYRLADNQLALNGGWDLGTLSQELQQLKEWDFDLGLLGFADLDALMRGPQKFLTDPDAVPDTPKEPRSQPGDVWLMGRHRLICGDSTDRAVVDLLLGDAKPHLMVTDPPYGVDYTASWRDQVLGGKRGGRAVGAVTNDDESDWREAWALFSGDVVYCWHAPQHASNTQLGFEACDFQVRSQIIWAKSHFAIGRGDYHVQHEPCLYLVRKGKRGHWASDRKQTTLWQIDKPQKSETGHSAQKPVECMRRPMENNSKSGDGIYDPFIGSGTSIIAAEMTGRVCYGAEINPAYIDVTVLRWQAFTGQSAIRESDGAAFGEAERLVA